MCTLSLYSHACIIARLFLHSNSAQNSDNENEDGTSGPDVTMRNHATRGSNPCVLQLPSTGKDRYSEIQIHKLRSIETNVC